MCGPYWCWFVELGYPNLDIFEHNMLYQLSENEFLHGPSGAWSIIEYYNSPVIPSLTRWNFVLSDIRNVVPTKGFVEKYVQGLDLHRKAVWDAAEAKSKEADDRHADLEKHAEDTAEAAFTSIRQNPDLMERIAKNGLCEIDPRKLIKHVPSHQLIGHKVR